MTLNGKCVQTIVCGITCFYYYSFSGRSHLLSVTPSAHPTAEALVLKGQSHRSTVRQSQA